jgi:putative transposase
MSTELGIRFAELDREFDRAPSGPTWLKIPEIARCVQEALIFGEKQLKLYALLACCIMPNHVHKVILPRAPLARITKSIKGFTARQANEILARTGERFWQDESYDHWVRSDKELQRIIAYVERNPVRAGLAASIEEWPWSSACNRNHTQAGMPVLQAGTGSRQGPRNGRGNDEGTGPIPPCLLLADLQRAPQDRLQRIDASTLHWVGAWTSRYRDETPRRFHSPCLTNCSSELFPGRLHQT